MKRSMLLCLLLCMGLALCACGQSGPAPESAPETAAPSPVPTPEPTPEPPSTWVITDESAEEILALRELPSLREIDATASREYEALLELRDALPECELRWVYTWQGVDYPSDTQRLTVTDLEGLEDAIRYLPELTELDLLESGCTLEDVDRLYEIRPDLFYLWQFNFYGFPTPIRTDCQVYSSLHGKEYDSYDEDFYYPILKYCKHLRALDLGHNNLQDLSLIGELTELQVLILADNPQLSDASPLAKLHNLQYLELFLCPKITDWSFLYELTNLEDLNLCYDEGLENLDFLGNMPNFQFGLFKYTSVPMDHYLQWKERLTDAVMVRDDGDIESTGSGWRWTTRNAQIRTTFAAWPDVYEYRDIDDVDFIYYGQIYPLSHFVSGPKYD